MKLPDIKYVRSVPALRSGKAAALQGDLATINAKVKGFNTAVETGVGIVDDMFEKEAKLDAGRRYQQAQREYTEDQADLVQEYHDPDKPLDGFSTAASDLREKTFGRARKGMSSRGDKYLDPSLDSFTTTISASEVKTIKVLTESRSKMHMDQAHQDNVAMLQKDPSLLGVAIALTNMNEMSVDNGLGQLYNQTQKAKYTTEIFREAVQANLLAGEFETAVRMTDRKAWQDIPQVQRLAMEKAIHTASIENLTRHTDDVANDLLMAPVEPGEPMNTALLITELNKINGIVLSETLLDGQAADDATKKAQGELVTRYMEGQIREGRSVEVQAELKTGVYNDMLDPADTKALLASAAKGSVLVDLNVNVDRAKDTRIVGDTISALALNPATDEESRAQAHTAVANLTNSYLRLGKVVPKTVVDLGLDLERAETDAGTTLEIWRSPKYATGHKAAWPGNSSEAVRQRALADAAIVSRANRMGTDAIGFARDIGYGDFPPLPDVLDPEYGPALANQMGQYHQLEMVYGNDLAGPLAPEQADALSLSLTLGGIDGLLGVVSILEESVGGTDSLALLDQINKSDDHSVIPVAARLAVAGQKQMAQNVLEGQTWLDGKNGYKPDDISKVKAAISEEMGQAFGEDSMAGARYKQAALALYTAMLGDPATRGNYSLDKDLAAKAVQSVTGGLLELNGRKVVAPTPGVSQKHLDHWRSTGLTADTLPPVMDAYNNIVPADEMEDGLNNRWFDTRFQLVEQGTPGVYYIMDTGVLNASGGRGGYMFGVGEDGSKGDLVTVKYNPGIGEKAPPPSPSRGSR